MKATPFLLCALLALPILAQTPPALDVRDNPLAATPAPAPPPQVIVVQQPAAPASISDRVTGWVAVGIVILSGIGTLAGYAIKKATDLAPAVAELKQTLGGVKERQDRQAAKTGSLQEQVTNVAIAAGVTPPPAQPLDTPRGGTIGAPALAFLVAASVFFLPGCANDPATRAGQQAAAQTALVEAGKVLGQVAVSSLLNVAQQELGGSKVDFGNAAAAGLWSQVNTVNLGSAIGKTVDAYSAGKATETARASAAVANRALAAGQPAPAVVNAVATVISTAVGAPPRS